VIASCSHAREIGACTTGRAICTTRNTADPVSILSPANRILPLPIGQRPSAYHKMQLIYWNMYK
jgi:hypothetical protein